MYIYTCICICMYVYICTFVLVTEFRNFNTIYRLHNHAAFSVDKRAVVRRDLAGVLASVFVLLY